MQEKVCRFLGKGQSHQCGKDRLFKNRLEELHMGSNEYEDAQDSVGGSKRDEESLGVVIKRGWRRRESWLYVWGQPYNVNLPAVKQTRNVTRNHKQTDRTRNVTHPTARVALKPINALFCIFCFLKSAAGTMTLVRFVGGSPFTLVLSP